MTPSTLTPAERIKRSAQRADYKRRQMASIGMMKCDCANVAVKRSGGGPVCQRCADIEASLANTFGNPSSGKRSTRCQDEFVCFAGSAKKPARSSSY
jgi:hypothetical protein